MTHLFPIPSPLPEGWRVVTARTQAECDAAFAVRCSEDTILVIEPRESIDAKIGSVLFGNRGGLGSINGESVRFYGIRWLIVQGGESPCHPDWVRSLRDQAQVAGVPFWFAGWGAWVPVNKGGEERLNNGVPLGPEFEEMICLSPTGEQLQVVGGEANYMMVPVGSSRSGRLLDGWEWSQVPEELQR